jgi:hypothetical protein
MNNCNKYIQKLSNLVSIVCLLDIWLKKIETFSSNNNKFYRCFGANLSRTYVHTIAKNRFTARKKSYAKALVNFGHYTRNDCLSFIAGVLKWWVATQKWVAGPQFLTLDSMRAPKFRH